MPCITWQQVAAEVNEEVKEEVSQVSCQVAKMELFCWVRDRLLAIRARFFDQEQLSH